MPMVLKVLLPIIKSKIAQKSNCVTGLKLSCLNRTWTTVWLQKLASFLWWRVSWKYVYRPFNNIYTWVCTGIKTYDLACTGLRKICILVAQDYEICVYCVHKITKYINIVCTRLRSICILHAQDYEIYANGVHKITKDVHMSCTRLRNICTWRAQD